MRDVFRRLTTAAVLICTAALAAPVSLAAPVQWTVASGGNGHWYEFVYSPGGFTFGQARAAALGASHLGMPGYLATVTSQAENDFIYALAKYPVGAVGTIYDPANPSVSLGTTPVDGRDALTVLGGSDAVTEGTWAWFNGPELGSTFWVGNATGSAPGGTFAWWNNPSTGGTADEPNNGPGGNEDYLQLRYTAGRWNDSTNSALQSLPGFNPDGVTRTRVPMAYLVEYGGTIPAPPAGFTVTNLNDSGDGSLRAAVAQANLSPGPQTIDFAPGLTGTIVLTSGQMNINEAVSIVGPGADKITIDGSLLGRVFSIFEDATDTCVTPGVDFPVTISGLTLARGQRNVQNSPGGAIYSEKSLTLDSVVLTSSVAAVGGGLAFQTAYPGQSLTIRNSSFIDNVAKPIASANVQNNGGGLLVRERCSTVTSGVAVNIADSLFQGNRTEPTVSSSAGAGIWVLARANVSITDTRIVGNTIVTQNPPVASQNNRGGGLSVIDASSVRIERTEIAGNSAERAAGMRLNVSDATLQTPGTTMQVEIVNSTIAANVATSPVIGVAGVAVYGNIALEIDNSTIAGNSAPADAAGGIMVDAGVTNPVSGSNTLAPTVTLRSSIVADSQNGAPDIGVYDETVITAFTVSATNSLIGTVEPIVSVSGSANLQATNPMLAALAFNGGSTRTRALQAGSPAINAGSNPENLLYDQRGTGFARVAGAAADMGAYEFGVAAAPVLQGRASRKSHGATLSFDLPLAANEATPTTEPRTGGAGGNHTIVFTFDKPVTAGIASVSAGPGTAGTPTFNGNEMRVPLSGVTNPQYVTVKVSDVVAADGGAGGGGSVRVGFLLGDVSQNRVVTVSDLAQVNAQIAQVVTSSNYLKDVNASGTLTVADKGIANTQITKALPTP
jgi:hypothetical protein